MGNHVKYHHAIHGGFGLPHRLQFMQVAVNPPILDREHCPGWLLQPMSKKYVSIRINYHPRQDRKRT